MNRFTEQINPRVGPAPQYILENTTNVNMDQMLIMVKSKNDEGGEKINLAPLLHLIFIESKVGVEVILKDF